MHNMNLQCSFHVSETGLCPIFNSNLHRNNGTTNEWYQAGSIPQGPDERFGQYGLSAAAGNSMSSPSQK